MLIFKKPDLTVITPVFNNSEDPVFFVANRGHHADIGGISPGSMPPMYQITLIIYQPFKSKTKWHFLK